MKDNVLVLDDGKEYIVTDEITYNGKTYLYMIENDDDKVNTMFCEMNGDNLTLVKDYDLHYLLCKIVVASRKEFETDK